MTAAGAAAGCACATVALRVPVRYPTVSNSTPCETINIRLRIVVSLSQHTASEVSSLLGLDQNLVHHAEVFVQQDVTVKDEFASGRGVAEIHAHLHAVIRMPRTFPVGNLDGIAQVAIRGRFAIHFQHLKMNLMHVKGVCLE